MVKDALSMMVKDVLSMMVKDALSMMGSLMSCQWLTIHWMVHVSIWSWCLIAPFSAVSLKALMTRQLLRVSLSMLSTRWVRQPMMTQFSTSQWSGILMTPTGITTPSHWGAISPSFRAVAEAVHAGSRQCRPLRSSTLNTNVTVSNHFALLCVPFQSGSNDSAVPLSYFWIWITERELGVMQGKNFTVDYTQWSSIAHDCGQSRLRRYALRRKCICGKWNKNLVLWIQLLTRLPCWSLEMLKVH